MIYILSGNDLKNKNLFKKTLTKGKEVFFVKNSIFNKELFLNYASSNVLFGDLPLIICENFFKQIDFFSKEDFEKLKNSNTVFVFQEDSLNKEEIKNYSKFAEIKIFEEKDKKGKEKMNVFSIADAFSRKDKINTWILFRQAMDFGITPESISGILFWKIKTMIMSSNKLFKKEDLSFFLRELTKIHHLSHRGEIDFETSLEQFILKSLSIK